jgi:hypothetical protein
MLSAHPVASVRAMISQFSQNYLFGNRKTVIITYIFRVMSKRLKKKDTITQLPSDPKKLEAYFKTLPPEVIEGFAQNALKEGERHDASEMAKLIGEIIFRLAWANKYGPIAGSLSDEQIQLLKKESNSREGRDPRS